MAYIGKVKLSNNWEKVEDLIKAQVSGQSDFAFAADTLYQLQSEGDYGARLCEFSAAPSDAQDGEKIIGTDTAEYKKENANYLYARVNTLKPSVNMLLKISKIGG